MHLKKNVWKKDPKMYLVNIRFFCLNFKQFVVSFMI